MSYVYVDLDYEFTLSETFVSDRKKIARVGDLFTEDSDHRFPVGAGIFQSSAVVSGGCNERRSHAHLYPYRQALHAEQIAIMSARSDITGSTIYINRYSRDGQNFRLARPCYWCCHQIIKAGIDRVVYTTNNGISAFKTSTVKIEPISSIGLEYDQLVSFYD